ncbi:hypothetical protein EI94DRAFT_822139 [Lactarius quietus]|nr:hypothetical protein EI94DRAFT_822139 [Lactarius quietus]
MPSSSRSWIIATLGLLPTHFITPEIARRIHAEDDIAVCVIGRCFASLVANRLAAKSKPFTDDEVACLSAIHCIETSAATYSTPGVVQLIGIVSLTFVDVNSLVADTVPPYVLHIVGQTISTLTQALSAELCIELQLNQADSWMNVPDSRIKSVIVSHLRGLFKVCTQRPFPLPEAVRTYCVQMCLYGLWCWVKVHRQLDASQPLPPEFLDLAGLDITSHIRTEKDQNTRVMGRCVEALVVINLVARIRSRTDSDSTIPLSDKESACISAILGTESHDLRLWLSQPGAVELATLVFSEIEVLFTDTLPSESIMPHMVEETCDIVYWQLPYELSAEMLESFDDLQRLTEPNHSPSRMCLKRLWQYAKVYNGLGISAPLPPFVPITLASPEFTQRLHAEGDLPTRVIGRCVQALIVNKLVDGFQSRISLSIGVDDAELASISSILGTEPDELLRWPLLSAVIDIKLQNVIFLMSGEIEDLFSPYGETPTDALHVVQQTLKVICSDPVLGGVFVSGDLPMNQVRLLRERCSNIANAYANRISVKEQLLKHMPTVERKIRRWTTTTFDPKSVRGLGNLTAQPEYEKRRRSWLV